MARDRSRGLSFLLAEGVIVVVSVLLALFLEDWRDDREWQKQADVAMARVVDEVVRNRAEMEDLVQVVTARQARLDSLLPEIDGRRSMADLIGRFNGSGYPFRSPGPNIREGRKRRSTRLGAWITHAR